MKQVIFAKTRTTRALRKRVPLADADSKGFTTVPDGTEELYYETSIDLDALHEMARKAATSKAGRSRDGALTVRILNRARI